MVSGDDNDALNRISSNASPTFMLEGDKPANPSSWRAVGPWRADYQLAVADRRTGSDQRTGPVSTLDLLPLRDRMNACGQVHVATGDGVTETRLEIVDMKAAADVREASGHNKRPDPRDAVVEAARAWRAERGATDTRWMDSNARDLAIAVDALAAPCARDTCPDCDQVAGHAGSCVWTEEDIAKAGAEADRIGRELGLDWAEPDSPPFKPAALDELAARGFKRINAPRTIMVGGLAMGNEQPNNRAVELGTREASPCQYPGCHGGGTAHIEECPNALRSGDAPMTFASDQALAEHIVADLGGAWNGSASERVSFDRDVENVRSMIAAFVDERRSEAAPPDYKLIAERLAAAPCMQEPRAADGQPCRPGAAVPTTCLWYDEDYDDATDPAPMPATCRRPATHYSCCYAMSPCANVCEEHACRCQQPRRESPKTADARLLR